MKIVGISFDERQKYIPAGRSCDFNFSTADHVAMVGTIFAEGAAGGAQQHLRGINPVSMYQKRETSQPCGNHS